MPDPVLVIAVGDCAVDGGVFKGSPAITGGADSILPVDLFVAGCPPAPGQIIEGLLALLEAQDRIA
jgi:Ni,Fe-hydrogenase III small subunit